MPDETNDEFDKRIMGEWNHATGDNWGGVPPVPRKRLNHGLTLIKPLIEQATEFVVVSDWSPMPGRERSTGGLSYEDYDSLEQAEDAFHEYARGEYPRARAVCLFASLHGIPIGRLL